MVKKFFLSVKVKFFLSIVFFQQHEVFKNTFLFWELHLFKKKYKKFYIQKTCETIYLEGFLKKNAKNLV